MAKPELGSKRVCLSCGAKFYDLNRNPILCPKCGTPFQLSALSRPRSEDDSDEDAELDPALAKSADFLPLEVVDAEDGAKVAVVDEIEDADEDIAADDDDTFLAPEEDEDDSDVADLIDGDIEDDEES